MNILDLLKSHNLPSRKVSSLKGGEYHSPCPTCGGGDKDAKGHSDRMQLFPEQGTNGTWYCRGCGKGGDAVEWLIFHDGMNFPAACAALGRELPEQQEYATPVVRRQQAAPFKPRDIIAPVGSWQEKASKLVGYAHAQLRANPEQLAWLQDRGITADTAHRHMLGWLPGENGKPAHFKSRKAWSIPASTQGTKPDSLWIPRGIVIPQITDDQTQRIRIRRPEADRELFLPDRSYHVLPGSGQAPLLIYNNQRVITVTESELDAILVEQEAGELTGTVSMGNSTAKPDAAAHGALSQADLILVALDFDKADSQGRRAGGQAWIWWSNNYRNAIRWPTPVGKDPGDAFKAGLSILQWIQAAVPAIWTEGTIDAGRSNGGEGEVLAEEPAIAAEVAERVEQEEVGNRPEGVTELGQLLQAHKHAHVDLSGGGCRIVTHPEWRKHFEAEFSRISRLVFYDAEVFQFLINHPAEIITGQNYWEGSSQ